MVGCHFPPYTLELVLQHFDLLTPHPSPHRPIFGRPRDETVLHTLPKTNTRWFRFNPFPIPKVGYVSSMEGKHISVKGQRNNQLVPFRNSAATE